MLTTIRNWSFTAEACAVLAGAALPLSFAPFSFWPLAIFAPVCLAYLLIKASSHGSFLRSFLFGIGLYGVGASWVFRSINDFGFANLYLALTLTSLFVIGLAFFFALPFYFFKRYTKLSGVSFLFAFACVWTLDEWLRSWFLTGFPWLFVGYAHAHTWLAGWAPIFGVFALSFLSLLSGLAIIEGLKALRLTNRKFASLAASAFAAIWISGFAFYQINWTQDQQNNYRVAIVQPNIPQHYKWFPEYYPYIMQTNRDLSRAAWAEVDLMLWPENAVPLFYNEAQAYLEEMSLRAEASNTALITGILYDDEEAPRWFNAIIGLGLAKGEYFKQRLVPFGEYVPMENWLRGTLRFFDLPHSVISAGEAGQAPLQIDDFSLAASICYEVVYPDLVASYAKEASLLLTISNDAWFGDSIGPIQHFEMAQMRALENGKYLLRATNTGVSGIISDKGKVVTALPQFEQGTLIGEVTLKSGSTPFSRWRSWPIVIICFAGLLALCFKRKIAAPQISTPDSIQE